MEILLRLINSAAFSLRKEVHSIRHALNLLGIDELKKWISLMSLSQVSDDKPEQLILTSISIAKFSEIIAEKTMNKNIKSNFFLTGLFIFIDGFLNRPMEEIVNNIPIIDDIKNALLGKKNIYRKALDLFLFYEKMDWKKVTEISLEIKINPNDVFGYYMESITWANQFQT
jgi:EAL and modified HD-GYP domain-containing signal transduction protein